VIQVDEVEGRKRGPESVAAWTRKEGAHLVEWR